MAVTESGVALGIKLKAIREANGLSQRELAKRAGVTNSSISMIEQGQVSPSVQSLEKVLSGIPMSLSHFFACGEGLGEEVFYAETDMQKHEKPYGYMQIIGEHLPGRSITFKRFYFRPNSSTGDAPLTGFFDQAGWIFSGNILLSAGSNVRKMKAGEGFYLQAYTPFRACNESLTEPAEIIVASPGPE
ncbi:helix-turn-helix domain-containing protein [Gilvimarinus sp. SDUM040013]|uniref:Helix-turn-helix domain-containing protein n=1 Tax=Gilvimarinus gilvus TaxID=3058038 RepID=A0ABU4RWT2_9GAMM|nr:helix-turn-helix domain-containing protein [Gilvimarinus sp. SDUM040013]MDX6849345.1 helix-turn-helix domain-containing protein [Gilvimarinus sp. SDUM040013]